MIRRFALFLSCFLAGCGGLSMPPLPSMPSMPSLWSKPAPVSDPTAEGYLEAGKAETKAKNYALAIDHFQKIKADFPFSAQVTEAELRAAEAYYLNKQYTEAIRAFQEFQTLHPTNENIPFVIYHLGLAHYDQFTSVERDQKLTATAKDYFANLVKNYPNSAYVGPAQEKLAKCEEYLAEHEFVVGAFYLKQEKYPAARERFDGIVRRYPNTPTAGKALYNLGEAYRLEKNNVKAALAYAALVQHYPSHPLAQQAQVQLNAVSQERQDPLALLLMRDGRPAPASSPLEQSAETRKSLPTNLVAKKDVVYEEPGADRSFLSRVVDKVNPFASSDKKDNGDQEEEAAATASA
jgi:outer membrane protein assembly factor BamD